MTTTTESVRRRETKFALLPSHVRHESFPTPGAAAEFRPHALLAAPVDYADHYMPDEATKDHARRMHYAAYKMHAARTRAGVMKWQGHYIALRDRIVLGNRKLIYRAVRRRMSVANRADDMIGDCHIVLIQAVAAFNPWMGIRFSTYAYTCLVRALSRLSQKAANDWLNRSLPLDVLPDGEPRGAFRHEASATTAPRLEEFFRADHPLLSDREKAIIRLRFNLAESAGSPTLETVGAAVGLSKERVRQVQASAIHKLRLALTDPAPVPETNA